MASNIVTNILAFVLVLGLLIFVHELGHFLVAKLFRVRVLVFSLGFGKRLFWFQRGDTEYRVSAIPLGGYVRMAGDSPDETLQGAPDEYLSKPKWQRFLILVAGPGMNLVVAIVLLAGLLMMGREVLRDSAPVIGSVVPDSPAAAAGLQQGDRILTANDEAMKTWDDFRLAVSMNPGSAMRVSYDRGGQTVDTILRPERVVTDLGVSGRAGVSPWIDTEVGRVLPGTPAEQAGVKSGDRVVSVEGQPVQQLMDLDRIFEEKKDASVEVGLQRGTETVMVTLPPAGGAAIGYRGFLPPTEIQKLGPGGALRESLAQNWKMTKYTFLVIGRLFRAEGSVKDFSGPISIARISGQMLRTGAAAVIFLMATISLQLGILNLLPIPVLDGGHIAILAVEGVIRRDLSMNAKEWILRAGFFFLAALMIVVLYNDVVQNLMLLRQG